LADLPDLGAIAAADGTFSMLAIDQRESLRTLLVAGGHGSTDPDLTTFKVAVAHALSPVASGILVDRDYGLDAMVAASAIDPSCGLIVAVDRLIQPPGGALEWSELDRAAMTDDLLRSGARALKFLVIWRPDDPPGPRQRMVRDFVDGCRRLGLLSLLEGLVQVPGIADGPAFDAAILGAAQEFAAFEPDLYKTHVPTLGLGTDADITRQSEVISAAIGRPWVVLSAGIAVERFPSAVAAACAGGASGFLAGRGVWGPSILTSDPQVDLQTAGRRRLVELVSIAGAAARPWCEAAPSPA
jgi:sulfofructosephosphate aldolase